MKWRDGVKAVEKNQSWYLCKDNKEVEIEQKNHALMNVISLGIEEDAEIVKHLASMSGENEITAGFTLAQFLIKYVDYIEATEESEVIEV